MYAHMTTCAERYHAYTYVYTEHMYNYVQVYDFVDLYVCVSSYFCYEYGKTSIPQRRSLL